MHRDPRALREALDAVGNHLGAQVPNLLPLQPELDDAERPVREVHHRPAERLVQRGIGGSEAREARGRPEGLGKGVAQGDADVFGGVVVVD